MREPLPLSSIQDAVLDFLRGRDDAVVFGAQAVNAYVEEPRMSQDIDLMSTRAAGLADDLRNYLAERFHVAMRVREIGDGRGYRVFQVRKEGNRHLVDVRSVGQLPRTERMADVLVIAPADLVATKVMAYHHRRGQPKSGTDWRDMALLLLRFPELKSNPEQVAERLGVLGASPEVIETWRQLASQEVVAPRDDDEF
ncbi:MAG: nucleotidyl transferase AbiEii/AbiGii toxin family protein [Chloroflexi bacterium]|nr:nucleotidyl transferase AbiEii/AbiGii toxin family protein [Chloroflexota bacterium]